MKKLIIIALIILAALLLGQLFFSMGSFSGDDFIQRSEVKKL